MSMKKSFDNIYNLQKALEAIGIKTTLNLNAVWYCSDNKTHYGIELSTDLFTGEDDLSFTFTPDGQHITDCRKAPIKNY